MQNKTTPAFLDSQKSHPLAGTRDIRDVQKNAAQVFDSNRKTVPLHAAICELVENMFEGRFWNLQPIDLRYHDFLHTLQAAQVYLDLAAAAPRNLPADEVPTPRQLELGFAAIMLHDTGYLKARGDDEGTGAKYTHCHVLRGCALAASILPGLGCHRSELDDVLGAIRSTSLQGTPADTVFSDARARLVACMVATADYIGQMAAPEYPQKLPALFAEFEEADNYVRTPVEKRPFRSTAALLSATPAFWKNFVLLRLKHDFGHVFRLLDNDRPSCPNLYFAAIESNLAAIAAQYPENHSAVLP